METSSSRSLEKECASLTIAEEDEVGLIIDKVDVNDESEDYRFVLVGRLAIEKPVKFNILKDTLASIWRPGRGMNVMEMAPNLFMFHFFHEVDITRILEDGPWAFEQSLLILKRLNPNASPFEVPLNTTEF